MKHIEAIVLTSLDYKDSSKILTLYTKEGFKSVLAHGVKKHNNKNRYLSQSCTIIRCVNPVKKLQSLSDGELLNEFSNIKQDPHAYLYMNHLLELIKNTITDDSDHEKMYHFITRLLQKVEHTLSYRIYTFIFELKLLHFLGYGLRFNGCSLCEQPEHLVFSISHGGLVCQRHLDSHTHSYDESYYSVLKYLYYVDIDTDIQVELDESEYIVIRHIIDVMYDEFVSFQTKSMKIIKQFEKY